VRLDVLEALGRHEEAQVFRYHCFERSLNASHLRAYLKRLPDFEDVEAENKALSFVLSYSNVHQALTFLVSWPALYQAAELVLSRADELDGNNYELLGPAADTDFRVSFLSTWQCPSRFPNRKFSFKEFPLEAVRAS
jgi:hypothetical protein